VYSPGDTLSRLVLKTGSYDIFIIFDFSPQLQPTHETLRAAENIFVGAGWAWFASVRRSGEADFTHAVAIVC
jgi:hypothetical protein